MAKTNTLQETLSRNTKISLAFGENLDINGDGAGEAMGQKVTESNQKAVSAAVGREIEIGTRLRQILNN